MNPYPWRARHAKELATQAQDLLAGKSLSWYRRRGVTAPTWALVNLLAHSSYDELVRMAKGSTSATPGSWDEALCGLASELLRMQMAGGQIPDLQRQALVPLELDLLGGTRTPPTSPTALISMVHEALGHPRIHR